ncbi:coumaroyl-CoA:anthocyanidin 3-O-glucoside-6''-O-coumaroyltransferase 1-like [Arachis stenosperma]|uniref:coumaroyl-CoA:anthocyanidin 3-O-glucoside-6''-O-coumaroyltransferase 1-like n=1 Tax=Arachis stenosperma TaxID=217475 RepID=UPI0025ACE36F|nr:coumaroyl-CoA:anthocyanidin 3-O-glucoside-6''-O-coumaroyltransferase 1-like [Arachis stenosperma]
MANKMNNHDDHDHKVKVIEQFQVGPPPGSVPISISIPFSFFDLPWLFYSVTTKRIFFYEFPHPTTHFFQKVLPNLKHSLSLTLQHFFPFSSKIVFPPKPHTPHILYSEGDTLPFIVAESTTTNLNNLVSDTPRDVTCLHPFVPILPSPHALEDGTLLISPMAIQVTIFPNYGFTICINFYHVIADGRSFHNFIKFWASICGSRENPIALPLHDRDMIIQDPKGLKSIFLETLWNSPRKSTLTIVRDVPSDMVRHSFVLRNDHVENLKKLVSANCQSHGLVGTLHVSTFVVTCSLIWVCKVKSEVMNTLPNDDEDLYFYFWVDCRYLAKLKIPLTYFGNCLINANTAIKRNKLVGQNGIFEAAVAIGNKIRELQSEPYKNVDTLMSCFSKFGSMEQHAVAIAGSPKFDAYETDFGWGKPMLSEVLQADSRLFSLSDCREKEGGIQVGVALGRTQMHKFNSILEHLLADIAIKGE